MHKLEIHLTALKSFLGHPLIKLNLNILGLIDNLFPCFI